MNRHWVFVSVVAMCAGACAKKTAEPEAPVAASAAAATDANSDRPLTEAGAISRVVENLKRVHFPFDSDQMAEESKSALSDNARILIAYPAIVIEVQGHCDDRGTTEYNLSLGDRRATAVQKYLARLGVPASQIRTLSLGKEKPLDGGNGEHAWAQNRRAEFRVMTMDGVATVRGTSE